MTAEGWHPRNDDWTHDSDPRLPGAAEYAEVAADLDDLADELVSEYAAAVDRIRDRAIESRYGGRILRLLTADPKYDDHSDAQRLAIAESLALE